MPIDPEIAAVLKQSQEMYRNGMERGNPPPRDGDYCMLLRKVSFRQYNKQEGSQQVRRSVITLSLTVVGDQEYNNYDFQLQLYTHVESQMATLSSFAAAAQRRSVPDILQAYEACEQAVNAVFLVHVERQESKKKQVFVNVTALQRLEEQPPQSETPAQAA